MFRSRVIVGESCVGNSSMKIPPTKPNGEPCLIALLRAREARKCSIEVLQSSKLLICRITSNRGASSANSLTATETSKHGELTTDKGST